MPYGSVIYELAEELGEVLSARKIRCAVAESCTGGSLAGTITSIPGSSAWFDRGYITYSNLSKTEMLGVPDRILRTHGAVSEETARAMAEGVISHSDVEVSVAITGIAGPGGGSADKPIGTVWIAWAGDMQPTYSQCYHFVGNRPAIRHQAVQTALEGLIKRCDPKLQPKRVKKTKERYFFALYPNETTAEYLEKQAKKLIHEESCSIVPKSKLHLTLAYLGNVPPDFVQEAMRIVASIKIKQFDLNLNTVGAWLRAKVLWLGSDSPPDELITLVAKLNRQLISAGFKPEKTPFIPHITIARKWDISIEPKKIKPFTWSVAEFCLVKSITASNSTRYEKVASWPFKPSSKTPD
ncbi:RNA 2',3'-cyclic phosphodiesterase [Legionella yabuuchiae]|uniref:RNA 2',3'-cyclic phosphodiesterase n=1 Tax=Legionella yabuuchiae TaxID=376727 RepID=UPI0013EF7E56|nr:RNA 2',3'-cyclic phosphodiesterase [Legionella yabuuchiae]